MIEALLDTNVVVALLAEDHLHYRASTGLLTGGKTPYAVAAHSLSEAYNTLTRTNGQFRFTPDEAWAALDEIRTITGLLGLSAPQTYKTIRNFAQSGGIGPRVYDRLIGEVAVVHGIPAIVTWNAGHMRSLFPALTVVTPAEWLENGKAKD